MLKIKLRKVVNYAYQKGEGVIGKAMANLKINNKYYNYAYTV